VHVSSSTISVALSERLEAAHPRPSNLRRRHRFRPPEAQPRKQLWVLAAGDPVAVERCMPLLEAIGRGVTRFGDKASTANS